jgi:D-3-phosphoglycerate dehydrogenase
MTRWTVLVTAPRAIQDIERYCAVLGAAGCDVRVRAPIERLDESDLLDVVTDVDAIICGDDRITPRVLAAAPRLRVISKWGTGIDSIDVSAARSRGIVVSNIPGVFSDAVADTVLGYVLLFARQLDRMAHDMRAHRWERLPLRSLRECVLGIVGLGQSGRAVARRASAFGMRMLAHDIQPLLRSAADVPVEMTGLDDLLTQSDFVTLHVDLRPESRHLLNASRFGLMKPSAVVINTSRGEVIDEDALIAALQSGALGGAALDVFAIEPLPVDSPLRTLPNVYLAPHNANGSQAAAAVAHDEAIRNVLNVLCGVDRT